FFAALLCQAAGAQPTAAPAKDTPISQVSFTVVDESDKPLPGAAAIITYAGDFHPPGRNVPADRLIGRTAHAGADGTIQFDDLENLIQVSFALAAPGYAAKPLSLVMGAPPRDR